MAADPIIRVENFTAGYNENILMKDINFTVGRGEVFVILGGSGCGKSTLLKHMIGLYQPMAGKVLIDGDDIVTAEGDRRNAILQEDRRDVPERCAVRVDDAFGKRAPAAGGIHGARSRRAWTCSRE